MKTRFQSVGGQLCPRHLRLTVTNNRFLENCHLNAISLGAQDAWDRWGLSEGVCETLCRVSRPSQNLSLWRACRNNQAVWSPPGPLKETTHPGKYSLFPTHTTRSARVWDIVWCAFTERRNHAKKAQVSAFLEKCAIFVEKASDKEGVFFLQLPVFECSIGGSGRQAELIRVFLVNDGKESCKESISVQQMKQLCTY